MLNGRINVPYVNGKINDKSKEKRACHNPRMGNIYINILIRIVIMGTPSLWMYVQGNAIVKSVEEKKSFFFLWKDFYLFKIPLCY